MELKSIIAKNIISLRQTTGMTQSELAEKLNYSDKAVSKWERNLSFPDVSSLPRLAEIFGLSVDELLKYKSPEEQKSKQDIQALIGLIAQALTVAMGVALVVLSLLKQIDMYEGFTLAGLGIFAAGLNMLLNRKKS